MPGFQHFCSASFPNGRDKQIEFLIDEGVLRVFVIRAFTGTTSRAEDAVTAYISAAKTILPDSTVSHVQSLLSVCSDLPATSHTPMLEELDGSLKNQDSYPYFEAKMA